MSIPLSHSQHLLLFTSRTSYILWNFILTLHRPTVSANLLRKSLRGLTAVAISRRTILLAKARLSPPCPSVCTSRTRETHCCLYSCPVSHSPSDMSVILWTKTTAFQDNLTAVRFECQAQPYIIWCVLLLNYTRVPWRWVGRGTRTKK